MLVIAGSIGDRLLVMTGGYAKYKTEEETTSELVKRTMEILVPMAKERVVAAIWTQTTDVEEEINGLLSYDREQKLDLGRARSVHKQSGAACDL